MSLKPYQTSISLNNLYEVSKMGGESGTEQKGQSSFVNSGYIDVIVRDNLTDLTKMAVTIHGHIVT